MNYYTFSPTALSSTAPAGWTGPARFDIKFGIKVNYYGVILWGNRARIITPANRGDRAFLTLMPPFLASTDAFLRYVSPPARKATGFIGISKL